MSRSGPDLYESDGAFDFISTITVLLQRQMAYLLSPEEVFDNGWWLAQVLTVCELVLVFERQDIGSSIFIHTQPQTVQRWRNTFLRVWDGEWKTDNAYPYIYDEPEFRNANRSAVLSLFDRMEKIAHFWISEGYIDVLRELIRQPLDKPLPHFSKNCQVHQQNRAEVGVERFTVEFIRHLEKEIIYRLSPEKREEVLSSDADEVWVSVDVLGFVSTTYQQSPGVDDQIVRMWRDTTLEIWEQSGIGDVFWADTLRQNILKAFDRLEAVAGKYPPSVW
jgi:hypothetical protein